MLVDLADIGEFDAFDVCVIGTGPAGLTVALELGARGRRVLLLEGGEWEWTDRSQALYRGDVIGDAYFPLDEARLRHFGGTTGHWGGWCRALDAADFDGVPGNPDTAWPIRKADLDPHLARASEILEIPPIPEDAPMGESGVKEIQFGFSPPVRLGETRRGEIEAAPTVFLALDANVLRLVSDGTRIVGATVRASDGPERAVAAADYVLAAGGIENSRILLWSNEVEGAPVVRDAGALGRYWMEHPHFVIGDAIVDPEFVPADRYFALDAAVRRRLGLPNCHLRLEPAKYAGVKRLIADLACVAPELGAWAFRQADRKLNCGCRLRAVWEQVPRRENRVALSATERDRFGVPRVELRWRMTPGGLETARASAIEFGAYLARADIGRVKLQDWVLDGGAWPEDGERAGYHHMGGTRMSDDPARGVVDRDCRVHGQANLHVAGSSVFPSGGHANPTLTIVQLALRLADHLGA